MSFKAPDSLSEQIAQHLGQLIITGKLKPGDRIQELRVANELNVSRGSVREAYLILARRYLIDIVPRKGAVVSEMTPKHVRDVYEMNILLIGQLCRRATQNWKEGELEPFLELLQLMEGYVASGKVMEFYDATFNFARMAYQFVDNPYLEDMLEDLQPAVRRTYYFAINLNQAEIDTSMLFFRELMACILSRDVDGAERKLIQFGEHQCDTVLKRLQSSEAASA
ncbi:GntR family transcriptional regulator [Ketobacter sp.]|uniref:GntR family transcriptional regulator n=1 Tax=Ketobacter sp. TaxID=2083498 RepID=UPI000F26D829|nr:GntR family transcriptional regulator [Ketobacter sp.]RLU01667.1 MAG: GntR family transcriptional regulator [Ketobacter sp.]